MGHCPKSYQFFQLSEKGINIFFILAHDRMKKPRLRDIKEYAKGHIVDKQ